MWPREGPFCWWLAQKSSLSFLLAFSVRHYFLLGFPSVRSLGEIPGSELENSVPDQFACLRRRVLGVPVCLCCGSMVRPGRRLLGLLWLLPLLHQRDLCQIYCRGFYGAKDTSGSNWCSSGAEHANWYSSFASTCPQLSRQYGNDGFQSPETFLLDEALSSKRWFPLVLKDGCCYAKTSSIARSHLICFPERFNSSRLWNGRKTDSNFSHYGWSLYITLRRVLNVRTAAL